MDMDLTREGFPGLDLEILQPAKGYRFSLDPFLLCGFARIKHGEEAVDLGTGAGVIPLVLARRTAAARVTGLEIQPELALLAQKNVEENGLAERIGIVADDLRRCSELFPPQSCDVVLCNPPYRSAGQGRQAPDSQRAAARHELAGGLEDFLLAAAYLLRNGGRLYLIHLAERLSDLLCGLRERNLEAKRMRMVHSRPGEKARLVLLEGRRCGRAGITVEPPLYVYAGDGYAEEVMRFYGGAAR